MPPVELKDRIRDLCTKALSATGAELEAALAELQKALHEHNDNLRGLVSKAKKVAK